MPVREARSQETSPQAKLTAFPDENPTPLVKGSGLKSESDGNLRKPHARRLFACQCVTFGLGDSCLEADEEKVENIKNESENP